MLSLPAETARTVLDAAPDALLVLDAEGTICFANRQASQMFGRMHAELIGTAMEFLIPERLRHHRTEYRHRYLSQTLERPTIRTLDLYGLHVDGSEFPVEISLSPISSDGRNLTIAAIRDVGYRKGVQERLRVAQLTAEQAREQADRANQAKSRFLATASHDLRQPLQTLAFLNGMLSRTLRDSDAASALVQQDQAIETMSRLLNALLDISKLESGAIEPALGDFSVSRLVEVLRRDFADAAAAKGLRFEADPSSAQVHSDPALVEQILRNPLSNSIKYTASGRVLLRCTETPDNQVNIEVIDTGIGIAAEHLTHIFDEFFQVDTLADSKRRGYGLGLSIVKRIVDLLGVHLEVRSQLGVGSNFSLILPGAHTHTSNTAGEVRPNAMPAERTELRSHAPRLLLVEDDPGVRDATQMLLRAEGYQVTAVGSRREALAAADDGIDLLVSDYHLRDGETGLEVIEALRQALARTVRAVLITGDTSSRIRELPREPYLRIANKPVHPDVLLQLIRELTNDDAVITP